MHTQEEEPGLPLIPHPKPLAQMPAPPNTHIHVLALSPLARAKGLRLQILGGTVTQNRQELFLEAE